MDILAPTDNLAAAQDAGADVNFLVRGVKVTNATGLGVGNNARGVLSITPTALITPPNAGEHLIISRFKFRNRGASTRAVSIYETVGSATYDATTIIDQVTLAPNENAEWGPNGFKVQAADGSVRMSAPATLQEFTRRVAADVINATVSFADVTGLVAPVAANRKYAFQAWLFHHGNAVTSGHRFAVNGPAAPNLFKVGSWSSEKPTGLTMTDMGVGMVTAYDTAIGLYLNTPGATAAAAMLTIISGLIENGANAGNLAIRFASEVAVAAGITVQRGSWMWVGETDS